ncbi:MAG: hypothetical protein ACOCVF_00680 [bacterium]
MGFITTSDKNRLFTHVKHELGYPLREFELTNDMLISYLEMVIEDYSALLNNWLIEQQWISLEGLDTNNSDFFVAYTTKSNDYMRSFTYAYSKQVGLGTNAPAKKGWELKRDFIEIREGLQHYIIPAGRQINEVLWETPPSIDTGLVDPFAMNAWSPGMLGWSYMGTPALYVQPTYSTLLAAQDRRMKQKVLQSTLTYRITGLESGEKMLHIYPIPGSRYEISGSWGKHYEGTKVWYWYYETNDGTDEKKCKTDNPDVVRLPSDSPIEVLKWSEVNDVAKQQIRNLLIAKVKMVIGGVRGFYSGEISALQKQLTLDYRHLLEEGEKLKSETVETIMKSLDKLSQVNLTEERARIAENINKERGYQPHKDPFFTY